MKRNDLNKALIDHYGVKLDKDSNLMAIGEIDLVTLDNKHTYTCDFDWDLADNYKKFVIQKPQCPNSTAYVKFPKGN